MRCSRCWRARLRAVPARIPSRMERRCAPARLWSAHRGRLLLADQKDVCFAAIDEGKISVVTKTVEGDSNCRTLEELMEQLDPDQFWRAHRSFVVNIQHIREGGAVVQVFLSTAHGRPQADGDSP